MRIIYTIFLLIGIPVALLVLTSVLTHFNDLMDCRFGKPPLWCAIIAIVIMLSVFVQAAWEQAGKWLQ